MIQHASAASGRFRPQQGPCNNAPCRLSSLIPSVAVGIANNANPASRIVAITIVALLHLGGMASAQDGNVTDEPSSTTTAVAPTATPLRVDEAAESSVGEAVARPTTRRQAIIRYATLVGIPLLVTIYGQQTWNWGAGGDWQWADEGWFGKDTYHGGADKMGHAWACYGIMRASHAIFDYTENGATRKVWYAAALSFAIGTGIEVGDAFNGQHGFSWEDIVADSVGIAIGALMETVPEVEAFVDFSATYWPTTGFLDYPTGSFLNLEDDSSGWTHKLSFKPAGFAHLGREVPFYVRYLMLDVGYYSRGYSLYDEAAGIAEQDRVLFLGVSINVPEVVDALFSRDNSLANRALREPFKYFYVPVDLKLESSLNN